MNLVLMHRAVLRWGGSEALLPKKKFTAAARIQSLTHARTESAFVRPSTIFCLHRFALVKNIPVGVPFLDGLPDEQYPSVSWIADLAGVIARILLGTIR